MNKTLVHRGPDYQDHFQVGNWGLGHTRLSILDLASRSHQPMKSSDGKVILTYNGEVYNYKKLRGNLLSTGSSFSTDSDTEVILKLYERDGENAFSQLNGMFAFAVLDLRAEEKLFLVRDRAGIKPLYYTSQRDIFAFASEAKAIFTLPTFRKEVSQVNLFHFLKNGNVSCPDTMLKGLKQVRPGTYLKIENKHISEHRYWSTNSLHSSENLVQDGESVELLDSLMKEVVADQIVSDVPLGCFLSGGIDSSLLSYYYSCVSSQKLKTFSIGYQEAEFDESQHAKVVAKHLGTDHHEYILSAKEMFDVISSSPDVYDLPFSDPTSLPTILLSRFASRHVKVALSGDGGDELFFGYLYQQILYKLRLLRKCPLVIRKVLATFVQSLLRSGASKNLKAQQIIKFLDIAQYKNERELISYFIGTIGPIRQDRLASIVGLTHTPINNSIDEILTTNDNWIQIIEKNFYQLFMLNTVLHKTDRASMSESLEVRVPFLDNRLIDFSSKLNFSMKYGNGTKKLILRKLLGKTFPQEIVNRPKQGFSIPLRDWLRNDLKFLLDEYLSVKKVKNDEYLNASLVESLLREHLSGKANHSHLLWSLIQYQMWKERYL